MYHGTRVECHFELNILPCLLIHLKDLVGLGACENMDWSQHLTQANVLHRLPQTPWHLELFLRRTLVQPLKLVLRRDAHGVRDRFQHSSSTNTARTQDVDDSRNLTVVILNL